MLKKCAVQIKSRLHDYKIVDNSLLRVGYMHLLGHSEINWLYIVK